MALKEMFGQLFHDDNTVNENIVAMTFLFLGGIPLAITVIIFCIIGGCSNSLFNSFHVSAIVISGLYIVNLLIALLFKAHEQGTLTGEQLVNSVSTTISTIKNNHQEG